jgi:hypothetical protein
MHLGFIPNNHKFLCFTGTYGVSGSSCIEAFSYKMLKKAVQKSEKQNYIEGSPYHTLLIRSQCMFYYNILKGEYERRQDKFII